MKSQPKGSLDAESRNYIPVPESIIVSQRQKIKITCEMVVDVLWEEFLDQRLLPSVRQLSDFDVGCLGPFGTSDLWFFAFGACSHLVQGALGPSA